MLSATGRSAAPTRYRRDRSPGDVLLWLSCLRRYGRITVVNNHGTATSLISSSRLGCIAADCRLVDVDRCRSHTSRVQQGDRATRCKCAVVAQCTVCDDNGVGQPAIAPPAASA